MGLAASQARYLALTARKDDLEFQSQTINSRRVQLAYKTAEIANEYAAGMSNQRIQISKLKTNTTTGKTETVWEELNFKNLYDEGFMVIGINGSGIPGTAPYTKTTKDNRYTYEPIADENKSVITAAAYGDLPKGAEQAYEKFEYETDSNGKPTEKVAKYRLKKNLTDADYNALPAAAKAYFQKSEQNSWNWMVTESYGTSKNDMDIQSLLVSGTGQIVTKAFFDFLVSRFGYDFLSGITPDEYARALDLWQSDDETINKGGVADVIDWRSDVNEKFAQQNYTGDDADVQAKYEAETAKIQAQDKMLEMEEKNIETQHKAISTELESIQKVIQTNIEKTFKIFS